MRLKIPINLLLIASLCSCYSTKQYISKIDAYDFNDNLAVLQPTPVVEAIADDILPAAHPSNPNIILYVSSSKGNMDIYKKDIASQKVWELTTHPADDTEPAYSPNGKMIAWTSQKADVKGDIWVMDADGKSPQQLTHRKFAEYSPVWDPQGEHIYFVSQRSSKSGQSIERINIKTRQREVIIESGWSPALMSAKPVLIYLKETPNHYPKVVAHNLVNKEERELSAGNFFDAYLRIIKQGSTEHLIFSRNVDDHNGDGRINQKDNASLWKIPLTIENLSAGIFPRAVPITTGENSAFFPTANREHLFFTLKTAQGFDIVRAPKTGLINPALGATELLRKVRQLERSSQRKFILRFLLASNPSFEAQARYELARDYSERQEYLKAIDELQDAKELTENKAFQAILRLEILSLTYQIFKDKAESQSLSQEQDRILKSAAKITADHSENPQVMGRHNNIVATIQRHRNDLYQATQTLQKIINNPHTRSEDKAKGWSALGEIALSLKNTDGFEYAALQILRTLSHERFYALQVAKRWIRRVKEAPEDSSMSELKEILTKHKNIPLLIFLAKNALAEKQIANGFHSEAVDTWLSILDSPAKVSTVYKTALLKLAEHARMLRRDNAALDAYESLAKTFANEQTILDLAESGITELSLKRASAAEKGGRYSRARDLYLRLLKNRWNIAIAHRRFVRVSAKLDDIFATQIYYQKRLEQDEGDAFAHYGLGLTWTYAKSPSLNLAEKHIRSALRINPKMAEAHLSMGWLRLQREHIEPNKNWLEKADNSFAIAEQLIQKDAQPELAAAVALNKGHTLYALGKTDEAFSAFLERELNPTPFPNKMNELIFREFFARTALREEEYDVGIDMAKTAVAIAKDLPGQPRYGSNLALVGSLFLLNYDLPSALEWLSKAESFFRQEELISYSIPILRNKILIYQQVQEYENALKDLQTLLKYLDDGYSPALSPAGESSLLTHLIEIEVDPTNISRAIYGFDEQQEEEIASTLSTRAWLAQGDLLKAKRYNQRRIELLEDAAEDSLGHRLQNEYLFALNDSALVSVQLHDFEAAWRYWKKALDFARKHKAWDKLITVMESLNALWNMHPSERTHEKHALVSGIAQQAYSKIAESSPILARRIAHFLVTEYLAKHKQPAFASVSSKKGLEQKLLFLDETLERRRNALTYAYLSGNQSLTRRVVGYVANANPHIAKSPKWQELVDHFISQYETGQPEAPLWPLIDQATQLFTQEKPNTDFKLQENIFMRLALHRVAEQNDLEQTFLLSEKEQLKRLAILRKALGTNTSTESDAIENGPYSKSLASALRQESVQLSTLRKSLRNNEIYLKFLVDLTTLRVLKISPQETTMLTHSRQNTDLSQLFTTLLAKDEKSTDAQGTTVIYLDGLHLPENLYKEIQKATQQQQDKAFFSEVLSATYFLAAKEIKYINSSGHFKLGGTYASPNALHIKGEALAGDWLRFIPEHLRVFEIGLSPTRSMAFHPMGQYANINFLTGDKKIPINLKSIGEKNIQANLAHLNFENPIQEEKLTLGLHFLLAGIPSIVFGTKLSDEHYAQLNTESADENIAQKLHRLKNIGENKSYNFLGYAGLSQNEEIDYTRKNFLNGARTAALAFKQAQKRQTEDGWRHAKDSFYALINSIDFLRQPASLSRLQASKDPLSARLPQLLPKLSQDNRKYLAEIHLLLKEYPQAIALQESIIQTYKGQGQDQQATEQTLALGRIYLHTEKFKRAAEQFTQCVLLSLKQENNRVASECLMYLGTTQRRLFLYSEAENSYHQALSINPEIQPKEEIKIKRLLGLVYESGFNNYNQAIIYFNDALVLAEKNQEDKQQHLLLLDLARTYRQRGDYEKAFSYLNSILGGENKVQKKLLVEAELEGAKNYWYQGKYRLAKISQRKALANAVNNSDNFLKIQALSLGGLIALNQGQLGEAEQFIQSSLSLSQNTKRLSEEAAQLNNLGIVYRQKGELERAEKVFVKALTIDKKLGSPEGKAYDLRNLGINFFLRGDNHLAERTLEDALELSRSIKNNYNELQTLLALARLKEEKSLSKSLALYQDATIKALELSTPEASWLALFGQGRIQQKMGNLDKARQYYNRAIEIAQTLTRRGDSGSGQFVRADLYAQAIKLAIESQDQAYAFEIMELARIQKHFDLFKGLSNENLNGRRLGLLKAVFKEGVGQEKAKAKLRRRAPLIAHAILKETVSFDDFRKTLDTSSLVASYYVGRKEIYALIFDKESAVILSRKLNRELFDNTIEKLQEKLNAFAPVEEELAWLQNTIPLPKPNEWKNKQRLILLPHSSLEFIPFDALPLENAVLLDYWKLSTAPHATFISHFAQNQNKSIKLKNIRAFAYAQDLPFAELEALSIGTDFNISREINTKKLLQGKGIDALHIAAHSNTEVKDILGRAILLGNRATKQKLLDVKTILNSVKTPPLVTLSACQSFASPKISDKHLSLRDAFFISGSRTVIGTLSRVSDLGTSIFMKHFYRQARAMTLEDAFHAAKQYVRKRYPHPAYWASLTLSGTGS